MKIATFRLHTASLLDAMRSTGYAWSSKAWCSAGISCFSIALIGAFRSFPFSLSEKDKKGHYVELNFSMRSYPWASRPCLRDYYLEIRDGNNQSANVLGVFCGDHKTAVVRSSGRYLRLRFFPFRRYDLNGYYKKRSFHQTSKVFLDKLSTLKAIG